MSKNNSKKPSDLQRVLGYAEELKGYSYISWVLSALSSLISLAPFWCIWKLLQCVMAAAPNYSEAVGAARYGWMALGFAALSVVLYLIALLLSHKSALRASSNIKKHMVHHMMELPLGVVSAFGSGRMRKIISNSTATLERYVAYQLPDKMGTVVLPIGIIFLLLRFDWRLGLLSIISMLIGVVLLIAFMGRGLQQIMKRYQDSLDVMSNDAVEYVRGISVVKSFGQSIFSFRKFKGSIDDYSKFVILYMKAMRWPMVLCTTAIYSVFAFLIGGGLYLTQGGLQPDFLLNLIFYVILTPAIALMMNRFMYTSKEAIFVRDAIQRMDSVLGVQPMPQTKHKQEPQSSDITLEHVEFSYDGKKNALDGINMKIKAGETVALVGPSGSGKTTLGNVISRFYDVTKGRVLIGGTDIKDIPQDKLMEQVSFVLQDNHLIKGTILDNVRMGKPNASMDEVMQALKQAQCLDIIDKFPEGVNTVIGTKGSYLSGGEVQRIAIARTLLKDTPIVILDEATAFADPDNESKVQAAFEALSRNKTVIMIAHRLSTVVHVDTIYVLDQGKIAEAGTFEELVKANGVFQTMWQDYQKSVDWKASQGGNV